MVSGSALLAVLAALAQVGAAVLALRLGRWTRSHRGWWLLGLALALLAVRRVFAAYRAVVEGIPLAEGEVYAVLVAGLTLLAVWALGSPLRQGFQDAAFRQEVERRSVLERQLDQLQELQTAILASGVFGAGRVEGRHLTWMSDRLASMLGQGGVDTSGLGFSQAFRIPAQGERLLDQAMDGAYAKGVEADLVGSRGEVLHARHALQPLDPAHPEHGLAWIIEDITEIRRALDREAALHAFLETVVDTADVWINTLDAEARIGLWNHAAERISGWSREDVAGRADIWAHLYPDPAYLASISETVRAILDRGEAVRDFRTVIRTRSGEERTLAWDSRALLDAEGRPAGSLAVGRDITEAQRTAAELERIHFIQDLILQHSALGLAFIRQRTIEWVNPRMAELLGAPASAIVGQSTRLIYSDEESYDQQGREVYEGLARGVTLDFRRQVRRMDGAHRWCRFVGRALDPAEPMEGSIWILEDIQERVLAEEAMAESEARFRAVFEGNPDALVLLTRTTVFDGNARALDLLGYPAKPELLGRTITDLSSPRQAGEAQAGSAWEQHLQAALLSGSTTFAWKLRPRGRDTLQAQVTLSTFTMGGRKVFQARLLPVE